jgi:hypothetical protein
MSEELPESAKVLLLELVFSGREVMQSKSGLEKSVRERLRQEGLIALEKRGRATVLTATDRTWNWAEENLGLELVRSQPRRALTAVLSRLREFLAAKELPLSAFVRPVAPGRPAGGAPGSAEPLDAQIRRVYLARTGGALHARVRLADLRADLPAVDRAALDAQILSMQREERAALFPLDNPHEIGPEDDGAAIDLSGVKQHVLYLRG